MHLNYLVLSIVFDGSGLGQKKGCTVWDYAADLKLTYPISILPYFYRSLLGSEITGSGELCSFGISISIGVYVGIGLIS